MPEQKGNFFNNYVQIMQDQELRNQQGVLIGKIKTLSDGKHELRDARGVMKGTYNPKTNETRDFREAMVGKGDLLVTLLR